MTYSANDLSAINLMYHPVAYTLAYAAISKFTKLSNPKTAGLYALTNAIAFQAMKILGHSVLIEVNKIDTLLVPITFPILTGLAIFSSVITGKFVANKFDKDFSYKDVFSLGAICFVGLAAIETIKFANLNENWNEL